MTSTGCGGARLPLGMLALGLGICILAGPSASGGDLFGAKGHGTTGPPPHKSGPGFGTLGYGPTGRHPGFQGFGLGYHRGYGFGGRALGVGADGGYPSYGGPGYPHPGPRLRRIGGINPFPHYGGPGGPTAGHPNSFGLVGPLTVNPPTVEIAPTPGQSAYGSAFGAFTGTLPYPEAYFAPYTSAAATGEPATVLDPAPPPPVP